MTCMIEPSKQTVGKQVDWQFALEVQSISYFCLFSLLKLIQELLKKVIHLNVLLEWDQALENEASSRLKKETEKKSLLEAIIDH